MKDDLSLIRLHKLHPKARPIFKAFIEEAEETLGIHLRIVQGMRTFAEQQAIYDQGRTKPGKVVTKAKPGSSYHQYGLAIDVVPIENGDANWDYKYELLYPIAEKHGLTCGGKFKSIVDKPHFEINFGRNWKELLADYNAGILQDGFVIIKESL